ncbi:MAG: hypothetical protein ACE5OZ_20615 [Candidatus Heimdallarchaeota archaeon]
MSGRMKVDLVYEEDDFKALEADKPLPEGQVTLTIDEESEKIILRITEGTGLVVRRTIQRRVQSVAKSGFLVSGGLRIGAGFPIVEEAPEEQLSDTLLQAGHGYIADADVAARRAAEIQMIGEAPVPTEKPAEQLSEPSEPVSPPVTPAITPSDPAITPSEPAITPSMPTSDKDLVIVGIFAASLLETVSELFVSKDRENHFSLDFGSGNVIRFKVQDGSVMDLSTLGISQEDVMIQRALNTIKTYLK